MDATAVKELVDKITDQINTLKKTGVINELAIIPVSAEYADNLQKVCIKLRNERYFIAYANEPNKPISVLWSDLSFIRKNFGIERYNPESKIDNKNNPDDLGRINSPVTYESLNYGRIQNLEDYKKAIELNVYYAEIHNLQPDGTFGTFESKDELGRKITLQRTPSRLPKSLKNAYQREVDRGVFCICKFVGEVELGFSV